jgi:hypothetical protein
MKKLPLFLLLSLLAIAPGCTVIAPQSEAKIWEYKTVILSDTTNGGSRVEKTLNELAQQGWVVQQFAPNPGDPTVEWIFLLRRPKA